MRNKISYLLVTIGLFSGRNVFAQADMSMATHWYNRANYNPAAIARTEYIYLFSNIRQQWIGVEGAPQVFNVQASAYIHQMRSAFGLSLVGEKIGATQAYNPMMTYAYRLSNNRDRVLSMGLSAGLFMRYTDGSLFEAEALDDPSITYDMQKSIRPDANVGVEFQSGHFIVSISSTHLLAINKSEQLFLYTNHRYGAIIYFNENPSLINYHAGLQVVNRYDLSVLEGNVSLRFKRPTGLIKGPKELFDIGLTYRTSKQMTLLFGINISSNLRIGYAYDSSFSTGYNQNGTHEVMMEFRILSGRSSTQIQCKNLDYWYH